MDIEWLLQNMNLVWVEISLLFLGVIFILIALFRPKDNTSFIQEKIEKIFEDFITQIDFENEEIIKKIKQSQSDLPFQNNERLARIEQRLAAIEQGNNIAPQSLQLNHKYEEVLKLSESGESVDDIAKKTQMGHAEIKLILELSKKGFKYV